jgi:hypothetical protein
MAAARVDGPAPGTGATRWDRILYWSGRFLGTEDFEEQERNYKLRIVTPLDGARRALESGEPDWLNGVHAAIAHRENNLTNWRATQPLEAWCRANLEQAALAFRFLWNAELPVAERFNRFAEVVNTSGKRILIAETSFLHMAVDPTLYPMFRSTAVERAMEHTGYPTPKEAGHKTGDIGKRYEHFLFFLDQVIRRGRERGLTIRDRLDAQGAAWTVCNWFAGEDWLEEDQAAFYAWQGKAPARKLTWIKPNVQEVAGG